MSEERESRGIVEFLDTTRDREQLKVALEVIREFKDCESHHEWQVIPFSAWAKIEQLEEFLDHLVNGEPLEKDTIRQREALKSGSK